jgi:hypothetical protein
VKQYRYVIVWSNQTYQGGSNTLEGDEPVKLPQLLRDGWRPVRETLMGPVGTATERDDMLGLAFPLVLVDKEPPS